MTIFQSLAIAVIVLLGIATIRVVRKGEARKRVAALWFVLWISGAVATLWPESTMVLAHALHIGRGADLVMYCSILATFAGFFYVYTRFRRLDRQLTQLVRQLAIEHPVRPKSS